MPTAVPKQAKTTLHPNPKKEKSCNGHSKNWLKDNSIPNRFGKCAKQKGLSCSKNFPLRVFLHCPKCQKLLTASASKGRTHYYHYYHCDATYGFRHKAAEINDKLIKEIQKHSQSLPTAQTFKEIIVHTYKTKKKLQRYDLQQIKTQLETIHQRQAKARDLPLKGEIEPDD